MILTKKFFEEIHSLFSHKNTHTRTHTPTPFKYMPSSYYPTPTHSKKSNSNSPPQKKQPAQYTVTPSHINMSAMFSHLSPLLLEEMGDMLGIGKEEAMALGNVCARNATLHPHMSGLPCITCNSTRHMYIDCPWTTILTPRQVWCSVVQCGAAWCGVLQCVAVCCSVLQHVQQYAVLVY